VSPELSVPRTYQFEVRDFPVTVTVAVDGGGENVRTSAPALW
jgi:hypothetical protein